MTDPAPDTIPFVKMHGLGNDFVVIDVRARGGSNSAALSDAQAKAIADRRTGVGCDQLIVLEPARSDLADAFMRIRNADGGEVEACGNAARCVASLLMAQSGQDHVIIETVVGMLDAEAREDGMVAVDMGVARLDWRDIPVADPCDTLHMPVSAEGFDDPVGVNIGNPHAVFFVEDAESVSVEKVGPILETHALFPDKANIEFAQILAPDRIRMRVWERGVGVTRACGTGACATLVAAARRGLTGRSAQIVLDGGTLTIEWQPDDHVVMTGPVATAFTGTIPGLPGGAA